MAKRTYQAGSVVQKNRKQRDGWDSNASAFGRYWKDEPGQPRRRLTIPLGIVRTRREAERKLREYLAMLKVNAEQTFRETTNATNFEQQAEIWLESLSKRKRNPLQQTTIDNRRYALDRRITPVLGQRLLAEMNNRALQELVEKLNADELSPATIRDYLNIAKFVVASAVDENGEQLFPRKWNDAFIDAPPVGEQHQPATTADGLNKILVHAIGKYRVLYGLLAGCGPMRVGEALGLEIDKHISPDFRTLYVRQKAMRGEIQPYLKTKNGKREVDLDTSLAMMLHQFVGNRKSGLLFQTASGNQLLQTNVLRDSLHPILKKIGHVQGGFNIFRRFRITHLHKAECPEELRHFWSGHAPRHVSERYTKLREERTYRLLWAERTGLGFELPKEVGQPGLPEEVQNAA